MHQHDPVNGVTPAVSPDGNGYHWQHPDYETGEMGSRKYTAPDGTRWEAFAADAIVAHGRTGAILAFRPLEDEELGVLNSTITFNSQTAANAALSSMSERELGRRLSLARKAAGRV